ncbi:MAG TPA: UvrD-helicase domain-containing protein [Gemmatimonadaceae bacterium]|nr:UvrD-helicase domain-containing protein [Gemmatimonadaceae bacterium]
MTTRDESVLGTRLNPAQTEAVLHDDGPMLVVAGAGSGKTRVLTVRIARLVQERGVQPDRILAVTFTNKAAGEMRERVAKLLGQDPRGLWIGTFHAIGARLMRRYAPRLKRTPGFTIYDPDDAESLIKRVMDEVRVSPKQWAPRAIASAISDAKNALVSPEDFARVSRDAFGQAVAAVYGPFDRAVERANAATFDDLLTLPVHLLRDHEDVARVLSERFEYILVDEYQDTNKAQYEIVRRLGSHSNVFVVGDDDQSIYGWRGADIRNILDFDRDFPTARVVRLEQNYRSRPEILALANVVIDENTSRRPKTLRPTREPGQGISLVTAADDRDEAEFVADELTIRRSMDRALTYGDIAVLYRTNAQSRPLEEALQKRSIPYRLIGQIRFYERREIKDMVAWLRLIANPADDEAFFRAIGAPRRGIGDTSLDVLDASARVRGLALLDAARDAEEVAIRGAARAALGEFVRIVDGLRARAADMSVDELLRAVLDQTHYVESLEREGPEAEDRVRNIEALIEGASGVRDDLEGEAGLAPLDLFLQRIALVTSADETESQDGMVTLMTLHNAKGLEFPVVFITGLEDGLLPLVRGGVDTDDAIEEERRLFYVGITRAEDWLYLTRAQRRWRNGETLPSAASRFIRDLPEGLVNARRTLKSRSTPSYDSAWRGRDDEWMERSSGARRAGVRVEWRDEAPALAVDDESQDAPRYAVGERVRHARFGAGTIIELGGQGAQAKARIEFDDESVGRKTLMLAQAHLERDWE